MHAQTAWNLDQGSVTTINGKRVLEIEDDARLQAHLPEACLANAMDLLSQRK